MRSFLSLASCVAAICTSAFAADPGYETNRTAALQSRQILPAEFKPPQVWNNVNLVRNINLDRGYPRETINVVIKNVDKKPQDEYYIPFEQGTFGRIGSFEVKDKKETGGKLFEVQAAEYDTYDPVEFYRVKLPKPLKKGEEQTLSISYISTSALEPLPKQIAQNQQQFVKYEFSAYAPSSYLTAKQKTKLKFPSTSIPDYTTLPAKGNADGKADPDKQGSTFTYGPYDKIPAGVVQPVSVRYEFTKPLLHATLLERDVEVSHWGGNLATEERYWLVNRGASLIDHFSRVTWAQMQYYPGPSAALKELKFPLAYSAANAYFTDDIGNISTSHFRTSASKGSMLEIKPRYPLFGDWRFKFRVGWDSDLHNFLRELKGGEKYVLRVPFLEGPKQPEGIEYDRVNLRVILPEGATDVDFETTVPIVTSSVTVHKTFLDTVGRPTLELTAMNVCDDIRDRELIVTYSYPFLASFRKPIVIFVSLVGVFAAAWVVGQIDTSIGRKDAVAKRG